MQEIIHSINMTAVISVLALVISVMAYRLSRRSPNQNKIFEEKIRAYHELIKIMNEAVNEIFACLDEYIENRTSKEHDEKSLSDELNGAIDDAIYSVEDGITDNSLMLPEHVLDKLGEFLNLIDKPEYLKKYSNQKNFKKLDEETEESFNQVIDVMRLDLEFDKLDKGLRSRIRGSKVSRALRLDEI